MLIACEGQNVFAVSGRQLARWDSEHCGLRFGYLGPVGEKIARLSPFPHHTRFL